MVILLRCLLAWCYSLFISILACMMVVCIGPEEMWCWVGYHFGQGVLYLLGVTWSIRHPEYLQGPAIFIANHQNIIDVVLMPAIVPRRTKFIAKRSLLFIPFWGWAFAMGGAILIDRRKTKKAMEVLNREVSKLPKSWSVVIFPEGTRSCDGQLQPFKKGAFRLAAATGLPIVPVAMAGNRQVTAMGYSWLLQAAPIAVVVGRPIKASANDPQAIDELMAQSHQAMLGCLQQAQEDLRTNF